MKKFTLFIFFASLGLSFTTTPSMAATPELYTGVVPVENQSPAERSRAMPLALEQVLQKLSGLRNFEDVPEIETALRNASTLAITFYYRNRQKTMPDGSKEAGLQLMVNFSKPAVDGLLQSLQLPLWKPERKPLTTWLIIDDGLSRRILPIEFEYAWDDILAVADARGMPLYRPQPDAEGHYLVDEQLLWGGYTEELVESGPADALVMAARREGPEWNVRLNLDYMGQIWTWRSRDVNIQMALTEGMQTAIDEIAAINSIVAADQASGRFEIQVSGLQTSADYVKVLQYLQGLSLVEGVRVLAATPGRVRFELILNALPGYFEQTLNSDALLTQTPIAGEYTLSP